MRTSELAGNAGVNTETLRYYERRGLLTELPRTPAGYRDYPVAAVMLLDLDSGGPDSCEAARALAEHRRVDPAARIRDLQRMHDSLAGLVASCNLAPR